MKNPFVQTSIPIVYLLLLIASTLFSCDTKSSKHHIQNITAEYYKVYQERTDFPRFLEFYDEQMILEDIILGEKMEGKKD